MIRFGTDGIRGRAGEHPCTVEVGLAVGRAATQLAGGEGSSVLVCRDTRPSGPDLEQAVASGVSAAGGTCRLGGVLPTSGLAAALGSGLAQVGVMLTASHNPAEDNGFKVLGPGGAKLDNDDSARVEGWLGGADPGGQAGQVEPCPQAREAYLDQLERHTRLRQFLRNRRIAVDLAHGASSVLEDWLRQHVPAELVLMGCGDGVTNDGYGSEHPQRLAQSVREHGCDAGLAVDGDGDRCLLVDEQGTVVPGDALAWLLASRLGVEGMAVTVMSNAALEPHLPGVRVVRTPVGDRHLAQAMEQDGLALGCEESGHVLFADGLPGGDGLLTGLRALALALGHGERLSQALAGFRPFPRQVAKVPVSQRPELEGVDALQAARREGEAQLGEGGRVFLRYSGTEPVLRVLVEGADPDAVSRVSDRVTEAAQAALQ